MTPLETWLTLLIVLPASVAIARYIVMLVHWFVRDIFWNPDEASVPTPITPMQERRRLTAIGEVHRGSPAQILQMTAVRQNRRVH